MNRLFGPYYALACGIFLSVITILEVFSFGKITLSDAGSVYFLGLGFLCSASVAVYIRARNFVMSNWLVVIVLAITLLGVVAARIYNLEFIAYWIKLTASLILTFYGLLKISQLYADGVV